MYERKSEWMVLLPSESLLEQLGQYWSLTDQHEIGICHSQTDSAVRAALSRCRRALIDATEQPTRASRALEFGLDYPGPGAMALYTEVMHPGLELFTRTRGVIMLLGPMGLTEWGCLERPRRSVATPAAGSEGRLRIG